MCYDAFEFLHNRELRGLEDGVEEAAVKKEWTTCVQELRKAKEKASYLKAKVESAGNSNF